MLDLCFYTKKGDECCWLWTFLLLVIDGLFLCVFNPGVGLVSLEINKVFLILIYSSNWQSCINL